MLTTSESKFRCRACDDSRPMSDRNWQQGFGMICTNCLKTRYFTCPQCGRFQRTTNRVRVGEFDMCNSCFSELTYWPPKPNPVSIATYDIIGSRRKYGLELESHTNEKHHLLKLRGKSVFGAKSDCTVSGKEFYSPILYGDEGLLEITDLCAVAAELGWAVSVNCGYHLHIDVRDESVERLQSIAYAYMCLYEVFRRCVNSNRHNGTSYCRQYIHPGDVENCGDFMSWMGCQDRYNFLNVTSYFSHGTFENRHHEGTFDKNAVINWVIMNLRIADAAATYSVPDLKALLNSRSTMEQWGVVKDWVKDPSVIQFYENRIRASGCSWFPNNTVTSTISA